jgi:hypothetical protein
MQIRSLFLKTEKRLKKETIMIYCKTTLMVHTPLLLPNKQKQNKELKKVMQMRMNLVLMKKSLVKRK